MWDFPRLLAAIGGLGLVMVGIRKKEWIEAGLGACFAGNAVFGYLAKSNDMYFWFQGPFVIAMIALVIARFRASAMRDENAGVHDRIDTE